MDLLYVSLRMPRCLINRNYPVNFTSMIKSLVQLTLSEFFSKPFEWPLLRDMFSSLIYVQQYPNIMKLSYLHLYVKGEALAVI